VRLRRRLQPRAHLHLVAPAHRVPGEEAVAHLGGGNGGGGSKGWVGGFFWFDFDRGVVLKSICLSVEWMFQRIFLKHLIHLS
jgi:hypothetical protein